MNTPTRPPNSAVDAILHAALRVQQLFFVILISLTNTSWADQWSSYTLDIGSSTGYIPSLAFSPSDNRPYIAYADYASDEVRLAFHTPEGWTITVLASGTLPSLAFNPITDRPSVAFEDNDGIITLATFDGDTWSEETLELGTYPSLAFNPTSGRPAICYERADEWIRYAEYNGTTWVYTNVVHPSGSSFFERWPHNLAFSPQTSLPGIAYTEVGLVKYVRFARSNGSTWIVNNGPAYGSVPMMASLTFGGGTPFIAFMLNSSSPDIKIAYYSTSSTSYGFKNTHLDPGGAGCSLAHNNATGRLAAAYDYDNSGVLRYAEEGSGSWNKADIDVGFDGFASLAFDPEAHRPAVAYHVSSGGGELRYAARLPDSAICVTPMSDPNLGTVDVGTTGQLVVIVENCGATTVIGQVTGLEEPFFFVGATDYTLDPWDYARITVQFAPTTPGTYSDEALFTGGNGASLEVSGSAVGQTTTHVYNVRASQRTDGSKRVDIRYNLSDADGDPCTVTAQASSDGGATWTVPMTALAGAVGPGIMPGVNRYILWTCDADLPGVYGTEYVVRVCANDGLYIDCTDSAAFTIDNVTEYFASVSGRVLDDGPGTPPIVGAAVFLEPGGHTATTLADGTFNLTGVPIASGYQLRVAVCQYSAVRTLSINVSNGVNDLGDILLTPASGSYSLRKLSAPDIHDGTSEVEEDCTAYRYLKVVRSDSGQPDGETVCVRVRPLGADYVDQTAFPVVPHWAGAVPGWCDAESGIVRLCIRASDVGAVDSTRWFEPVLPDDSTGDAFQVTVVPRRYEHGWSQAFGGGSNVGVGISDHLGIRAGGEGGYLGSVTRPYGSGGDVEQVTNGSRRRQSFGLAAGPLPASASVEFLDAKWGVTASGQIGDYGEVDTRFAYGFDTTTPPDVGAAALRLYCFYASAPDPITDPAARFFIHAARTLLEPIALPDYWRWSEAGWEVGSYGKVEGTLAIPGFTQFPVTGSAEVGGEVGVRIRSRYDQAGDKWLAQFGVVGQVSANVDILFGLENFVAPGAADAFRQILANLQIRIQGGGALQYEQLFEIETPDGATRPTAVRLITAAGGPVSLWEEYDAEVPGAALEETDLVKLITVEQPISSSAEWARAASLPGAVELLTGTGATVIDAAFGTQLASGMFGQPAYAMAMKYSIGAELRDPWNAPIGAQGTYIFHLGFRFQADVLATRSFELENGKIRGGQVFPLQSTLGAIGIPPNTQNIVDIQASWAAPALDWLQSLGALWDTFVHLFGGSRSDDVIQVPTTAGSAELVVPSGTFPAGTMMTIDSWADEAVATNGWMYGVGGMYRFEADAAPAGPMTLRIEYLDATVAGVPEAELRIYTYDVAAQSWQLVGGIVEITSNAVTAAISTDGLYTAAPPMPSGKISFQFSATLLPADGTSTAVAQATDLKLNTGATVADGTLYVVGADGMDIVTADADAVMPGVQLISSNGAVSIEFQAPTSGGIGFFVMESVVGDAAGSGMIAFEDDVPPPVVTGLQLAAGQSRVLASWDTSGMPDDVSYYRVYYCKDHAPPPFDGTAMVEGVASPVPANGSSCVIRGLAMGSEYHVAVSAVDAWGNEGPLSNVVSGTTAEAPPAPPSEVRFAEAQDGSFDVTWSLSEDDGFNDRDVDHYEVSRWIVPGGGRGKIADVPAGRAAYVDVPAGVPVGALVLYEVAAVDTGGLSSPAVGIPFDGDFDQDGDVDLDDYNELADCLTGPIGLAPGDYDADYDVDLQDFVEWAACLTGPDADPGVTCAPKDLDQDGDVDLADFAITQALFNEPTGLVSTDCEFADIDLDMDVDLLDFAIFQMLFPGIGS